MLPAGEQQPQSMTNSALLQVHVSEEKDLRYCIFVPVWLIIYLVSDFWLPPFGVTQPGIRSEPQCRATPQLDP